MHIKNYKCFKDLKLQSVGRVNLIAGKNNVGKTTLLEAVALAARGGDPAELFRILDRRERPNSEATLLQSFLANFPEFPCCIGFHEYGLDEIQIDMPGAEPTDVYRSFWRDFRREGRSKLLPSFSIRCGIKTGFQYELTMDTRNAALSGSYSVEGAVRDTMRTLCSNLELIENPKLIRMLWDEIEARPVEDDLITALRLIEPGTARITLPSTPDRPTPRLRIGAAVDLAPITRFGDGMKRLFEMALVLVNAKDGIVLLDEIENGIHHSVMPKLWEFLFAVSEKLNITVFATTHSQDATNSFAKRSIMYPPGTGVLTRLDRRKAGIVPVQYGNEEALIAAEEGFEVR